MLPLEEFWRSGKPWPSGDLWVPSKDWKSPLLVVGQKPEVTIFDFQEALERLHRTPGEEKPWVCVGVGWGGTSSGAVWGATDRKHSGKECYWKRGALVTGTHCLPFAVVARLLHWHVIFCYSWKVPEYLFHWCKPRQGSGPNRAALIWGLLSPCFSCMPASHLLNLHICSKYLSVSLLKEKAPMEFPAVWGSGN